LESAVYLFGEDPGGGEVGEKSHVKQEERASEGGEENGEGGNCLDELPFDQLVGLHFFQSPIAVFFSADVPEYSEVSLGVPISLHTQQFSDAHDDLGLIDKGGLRVAPLNLIHILLLDVLEANNQSASAEQPAVICLC
jgi:hypothetical protein